MSTRDKYDMLMDIATEEFSPLGIACATVTMLLNGINGELKNAAERSDLMKMMKGKGVEVNTAVLREKPSGPGIRPLT